MVDPTKSQKSKNHTTDGGKMGLLKCLAILSVIKLDAVGVSGMDGAVFKIK